MNRVMVVVTMVAKQKLAIAVNIPKITHVGDSTKETASLGKTADLNINVHTVVHHHTIIKTVTRNRKGTSNHHPHHLTKSNIDNLI